MTADGREEVQSRERSRGGQWAPPPSGHDEAKVLRAERRRRHLQRDVKQPSRKYGNLAGYYPYGVQRAAFRKNEKWIQEVGEEAVPQLVKSGSNWWDCGRHKCHTARLVWKPKLVGIDVESEESTDVDTEHSDADDQAYKSIASGRPAYSKQSSLVWRVKKASTAGANDHDCDDDHAHTIKDSRRPAYSKQSSLVWRVKKTGEAQASIEDDWKVVKGGSTDDTKDGFTFLS